MQDRRPHLRVRPPPKPTCEAMVGNSAQVLLQERGSVDVASGGSQMLRAPVPAEEDASELKISHKHTMQGAGSAVPSSLLLLPPPLPFFPSSLPLLYHLFPLLLSPPTPPLLPSPPPPPLFLLPSSLLSLLLPPLLPSSLSSSSSSSSPNSSSSSPHSPPLLPSPRSSSPSLSLSRDLPDSQEGVHWHVPDHMRLLMTTAPCVIPCDR